RSCSTTVSRSVWEARSPPSAGRPAGDMSDTTPRLTLKERPSEQPLPESPPRRAGPEAPCGYLARHPDPPDHWGAGPAGRLDAHGAASDRDFIGVYLDARLCDPRHAAAPDTDVNFQFGLRDDGVRQVQPDAAAGNPHLHSAWQHPLAVSPRACGAAVNPD